MLNLKGGDCCNIKENLSIVSKDKEGNPIPCKTKPDCYLVRCKCFHGDYVPIRVYKGLDIEQNIPESEEAQAK